jgi:hypothetical protein
MGLIEKLQARMSHLVLSYPSIAPPYTLHTSKLYHQSPRRNGRLTGLSRSRTTPPRTTLHTPRKTHNLHQRSAIRGRRIRLCRINSSFFREVFLHKQQHEQQAVQQDARHTDKGAWAYGYGTVVGASSDVSCEAGAHGTRSSRGRLAGRPMAKTHTTEQ